MCVGGGGDTRSCSRMRIKTEEDDEFFISAVHSDIISMRRGLRNALPIAAGGGWWLAVCRAQPVPRTLHHASARLMSALFINFNLSFSPTQH